MKSIKIKPIINELQTINSSIIEVIGKNDNQIDLIVEEIFVNICNYSNATEVIINMSYDDNSLILEFIDDGFNFNPLEMGEHQMPDSIEEATIGGLGVHLVKNLSDNLEYDYDGKNHLTITKKVK